MNVRCGQCNCTQMTMRHDSRGEVNVHVAGGSRLFEARCARFAHLGLERGEGFIDPIDGGSSEAKPFPRVVKPGRFGVATYIGPICWVVPGPFA